MPTPPTRRMAPAAAAARGAQQRAAAPKPVPKPVARRGSTEHRAMGYVTSEVSDREGPYHHTTKEVELLRTTFEEGQHPTFVKVGAGLTIPLAEKYTMLRIDVSITIPCLFEERDDAYEIASNFCVEKAADEERLWQGEALYSPEKQSKR